MTAFSIRPSLLFPRVVGVGLVSGLVHGPVPFHLILHLTDWKTYPRLAL